jgi:hypothetical protein
MERIISCQLLMGAELTHILKVLQASIAYNGPENRGNDAWNAKYESHQSYLIIRRKRHSAIRK